MPTMVTSSTPQEADLFDNAVEAADTPVKNSSPTAEKKQTDTLATNSDIGEIKNEIVPDKRYFTISEAAELCGAKPHVLRYWESEFKQLAPVKRAGNRRYYQRQDIFLIRQIRELLHEQGFTIAGAKQKLTAKNSKEELSVHKQALREIRQELEQILRNMKR